MARKKADKSETFSDEVVNSYLRKSINADQIKKEMSEFKSSLGKFSDEESD